MHCFRPAASMLDSATLISLRQSLQFPRYYFFEYIFLDQSCSERNFHFIWKLMVKPQLYSQKATVVKYDAGQLQGLSFPPFHQVQLVFRLVDLLIGALNALPDAWMQTRRQWLPRDNRLSQTSSVFILHNLLQQAILGLLASPESSDLSIYASVSRRCISNYFSSPSNPYSRPLFALICLYFCKV